MINEFTVFAAAPAGRPFKLVVKMQENPSRSHKNDSQKRTDWKREIAETRAAG
jgi:hypothetical protein